MAKLVILINNETTRAMFSLYEDWEQANQITCNTSNRSVGIRGIMHSDLLDLAGLCWVVLRWLEAERHVKTWRCIVALSGMHAALQTQAHAHAHAHAHAYAHMKPRQHNHKQQSMQLVAACSSLNKQSSFGNCQGFATCLAAHCYLCQGRQEEDTNKPARKRLHL